MSGRDVLMDVSRLVWRLWRGRPPTGVDRVCTAYVEHFRERSRAVVQRHGRYYIFDDRHSDRLFDAIERGPAGFRSRVVRIFLRGLASARRNPETKGIFYLNVGHTGLDNDRLGAWIAASGSRAVFLIHDLIPLLHPEHCRPGEAARHRRRTINALTSATGIIGNSAATLRDLESFAVAEKIPMPASVSALIAPSQSTREIIPRDFGRPHFVVVGTIEGRKNHTLLLNVWKRMALGRGNIPLLVIVGQRGWAAEAVFSILDRGPHVRGHVIELPDSSDQELASIIAGARALLMPSFAEGYGLPVAEALDLGTPVIASDLPVFREFAGDIPTYLDPLHGPAWEREITSFLSDCPERGRQLAAVAHYRAPDWRSHFRSVDKWMKTLR